MWFRMLTSYKTTWLVLKSWKEETETLALPSDSSLRMDRWHHASDREAILIIERLNVYDIEEISEEELKDSFKYTHDRLHGHF